MVDTCPIEPAIDDQGGIFVVINGDGTVLQPDGTWGDFARSFHSVEEARAARPGHADGTATSRVIFASQRKKWGSCPACRIAY